MKFTFYFILLLYIPATKPSIYTNIKDNVLSFLKRSYQDDPPRIPLNYNAKEGNPKDVKVAKDKAQILMRAKRVEKDLNDGKGVFGSKLLAGLNLGRQHYHMDPVLNDVNRRSGPYFRRRSRPSSSSESSSSLELKNWKDEWREHWIHKKFEALNGTQPTGDVVNMAAARPWGVPCGDPNQHDMPWGTCMLPMECEAEYRIYRGDYFCGRSQFICCALQLNTYDMYQGFDVSFADSSLATDSAEKRNRGKGSKERRRKKKQRDRRRRKRQRLRRKRKIKKNIKKIIKEIRKILNRSYRNGTTARKKKTKQLKRFIKDLKKQYRKDRKSVKDIHELEIIRIDSELQKRLNQIRDVNQNFMKNSTFRDIVVNGTLNRQGARMLMEAYPELSSYLRMRRSGTVEEPDDYLQYDIEYGLLYY